MLEGISGLQIMFFEFESTYSKDFYSPLSVIDYGVYGELPPWPLLGFFVVPQRECINYLFHCYGKIQKQIVDINIYFGSQPQRVLGHDIREDRVDILYSW